MKKIKKKKISEGQINEFIVSLAKAIMGRKAIAVAKVMQHDPGLKDAFERYARETERFRDHIKNDYGFDSPEELATAADDARANLQRRADALKKKKKSE